MELLKNIMITNNEPTVFVYHSTAIIPDYDGDREDIVTNILLAKLQPELQEFIDIATSEYIQEGKILKVLQYQNISQSFTGYERFWLCDDQDHCVEENLKNLSPSLIEKITNFGLKIIQVIQGGN